MKKNLRNIIAGALLGASVLFAGCQKEISSLLGPKNELSPYTLVLSEKDIKNISSVGENRIDFSEPVSFSTGDIVSTGISDSTPYGLLKKVNNVSEDKKTIQIEDATLEEAVKNASFELEVSPPSGEYILKTKEGTFKKHHEAGSLNINHDFKEIVLYDADGDKTTTEDQITANGNFNFYSKFFINCDIQNNSLKELSFRNKSDIGYELEINSSESLEDINKEIKIAQYNFPPFNAGVIPGTPLPIIIKPELQLYIGLEGSISPIETSITEENSISAGVSYKDKKWDKDSDFSNSFNFSPPELSKISNLNAYVEPRLNFLVYGIAGPSAEIEGSLAINSEKSSWKMLGGLEANLGMNSKVFSKNLDDYYANLVNFSKILFQQEKELAERGPQTLEDYFLQGEELEGISLIQDIEGRTLPYILNKREIAKMREENWELDELNLIGLGAALYNTENIQSLKASDPNMLQLEIWQFKENTDAWDFLNKVGKEETFGFPGYGNVGMAFISKGFVPIFILDEELDINTERAYLDSLINYQKRIGGEFYLNEVYDEDPYKILDIPISKSGEYFREAAKFQRTLYNMSKEELNGFIKRNFISPIEELVESYEKKNIPEEEAIRKVSELGKRMGRNFIFMLPNLNKKFIESFKEEGIDTYHGLLYLTKRSKEYLSKP